jgi:hypothetical protein
VKHEGRKLQMTDNEQHKNIEVSGKCMTSRDDIEVSEVVMGWTRSSGGKHEYTQNCGKTSWEWSRLKE